MPQHYYGARNWNGAWRGYVYHYNPVGSHEVPVWSGGHRDTPEEAIDDAAEWLEENDIEAEME